MFTVSVHIMPCLEIQICVSWPCVPNQRQVFVMYLDGFPSVYFWIFHIQAMKSFLTNTDLLYEHLSPNVISVMWFLSVK